MSWFARLITQAFHLLSHQKLGQYWAVSCSKLAVNWKQSDPFHSPQLSYWWQLSKLIWPWSFQHFPNTSLHLSLLNKFGLNLLQFPCLSLRFVYAGRHELADCSIWLITSSMTTQCNLIAFIVFHSLRFCIEMSFKSCLSSWLDWLSELRSESLPSPPKILLLVSAILELFLHVPLNFAWKTINSSWNSLTLAFFFPSESLELP